MNLAGHQVLLASVGSVKSNTIVAAPSRIEEAG